VLRPDGSIAITTNLHGHMAEFYDVFAATLRDLGRHAELERLNRHIEHRATVEGVRRLFEGAGLRVTRVEREDAVMRFSDGSALLRHHFIKLGFLDAWKDVVDAAARVQVFAELEKRLNEASRAGGVLALTVPLAYVEGAPA
jgi:hypothetical protein